jgi:hypothetical protein
VLVADLGEERGRWSAETGSWSVAECLDHLANANRVYLDAMRGPAVRAREQGRFRRDPAVLGFAGRWLVRTLEPPVKALFRMKAPRTIEPRRARALATAFASFTTSQDEVHEFLCAYADLDVRTRRPLQPGHWRARYHGSREAPFVASLARASRRGGLGCGTVPS